MCIQLSYFVVNCRFSYAGAERGKRRLFEKHTATLNRHRPVKMLRKKLRGRGGKKKNRKAHESVYHFVFQPNERKGLTNMAARAA